MFIIDNLLSCNNSLAVHLYMRALTLNGTRSCQAAVLMNNLANSYSNMGHYEEAKIWGQKGLDLAQNPNTGKVNEDSELCDQTCGVLLFNMGMLFEVSIILLLLLLNIKKKTNINAFFLLANE